MKANRDFTGCVFALRKCVQRRGQGVVLLFVVATVTSHHTVLYRGGGGR
jgi:hypothetical protein